MEQPGSGRPSAPAGLASGAQARWTNEPGPLAVVLLAGGRGADVPGTWSSTLEWLVGRLAPAFPGLGFLEVRYRSKSWRTIDRCVRDATDALDLAVERGAVSCALVGFSMGGAVAASAAGHQAVSTVVGLAPWLPDRLDLTPLRGRRFAVIHGSLDRSLPGVPGVRASSSRRGYERAQELGVAEGSYTVIRGGLHGAAVRGPWGLAPLPRARRWAELLARELELFSRRGAKPGGGEPPERPPAS